jgi:pimeloyl-ACP methyl ester carboxylesterase
MRATARPARTPTGQQLPTLRGWPAAGRTGAVVLVLHGGREDSRAPTSACQLAYRRMVPIGRSLARSVRGAGVAVWLVRNRVRGWNEPARDALTDARWALRATRRRHPDAAIVLVGHSMGGRAALLAAGEAGVLGVCALAPWLTPDDPVDQLAGRAVLIAHGDRDTWTDPARSEDYAVAARAATPTVCRFVLRDAGHAMLRRSGDWTGLVRAFAAGLTGARAPHPLIEIGMRTPTPDGLRLELPRRVW